MDILYDPVKDIITENDILRKNNGKNNQVKNVLDCSYCFRRICFDNYDVISDDSNEEILGFVCKKLEGVLVDTLEPQVVKNSEKWYQKFMKAKPVRKRERKNKRSKKSKRREGDKKDSRVRGSKW